ncbi:MAG: sulfotransferase, partial [Nitrospira sp.]|nr:sulfotransferase [Nitrospira sp.]
FRFCYHRYDPISDFENIKRLVGDMAYRLYNRFEITFDQDECLALLEKDTLGYGQTYVSILRTLFGHTSKRILGDKEALAWTKIPDFLRMCPNGKVIVILRDPRDVVTSFKYSTIAPGNDYLIALFNVVDAVNHAFRYRLKYPSQVYIVTFEHLKINTEDELRRLCNFIEVEFMGEMLDRERYTDHMGKKWDAGESLTFKEETDWLAPVGRWRRRIEPEDLYLCEWIGGKQIAQLGLGLDGRVHSQEVFDKAIEKITSSNLLSEAFKRWCDVGEGMERFPLDPLNPANWDPGWVRHPEAFTKGASPSGSG